MSRLPALESTLIDQMHQLYRELHGAPELSMQEHATAERLEGILDELDIEHFRCGGTGVVGILRNGEGPVIGFRADTDGLPIAEDTGVDYASTATGRLEDGTEVPTMHGCGHDTHMATAVTAVRWLVANREAWAGTLVIIFQPGEETAAGAKAMVADGLWDRAPKPEVVYGQHVMPALTGTINYAVGDAMALADSWRVTLRGRGSHGSQPQDSIDPIVLGAHIVTRLQGVVSREIDPRQSAVVTVGTFHAGLKENIIPAEAELTLNVRNLSPEVRDQVLSALRRIILGEAAVSGAPEPIIEEISSFPRNYNDPEQTELLVTALRNELGEEAVTQVAPPMGSEDFGALTEAIGVPSVFWFFGGYNQQTLDSGEIPVNHSPHFLPEIEPTLTTGTRAALTAILSKLGR
ncbi:MAG: amidohydrolase [Micrococcaceae bacterium]